MRGSFHEFELDDGPGVFAPPNRRWRDPRQGVSQPLITKRRARPSGADVADAMPPMRLWKAGTGS